jgi:hypothetical protein
LKENKHVREYNQQRATEVITPSGKMSLKYGRFTIHEKVKVSGELTSNNKIRGSSNETHGEVSAERQLLQRYYLLEVFTISCSFPCLPRNRKRFSCPRIEAVRQALTNSTL